MRPDRAWVRLSSGRRLDLIAPQPTDWTDLDLAVGLSRTYRWGGHSIWDLPLSVTQHSLLVLVLRQQIQPHQPLTPGEALRELLHDADEGLVGFDPISPLKLHLGSALGAAFSHLPADTRGQCMIPLTGDSLNDIFVHVEFGEASRQHLEGIIVDGARDGDGEWLLDEQFTVFTTEEEFVLVSGWGCHVELQ